MSDEIINMSYCEGTDCPSDEGEEATSTTWIRGYRWKLCDGCAHGGDICFVCLEPVESNAGEITFSGDELAPILPQGHNCQKENNEKNRICSTCAGRFTTNGFVDKEFLAFYLAAHRERTSYEKKVLESNKEVTPQYSNSLRCHSAYRLFYSCCLCLENLKCRYDYSSIVPKPFTHAEATAYEQQDSVPINLTWNEVLDRKFVAAVEGDGEIKSEPIYDFLPLYLPAPPLSTVL